MLDWLELSPCVRYPFLHGGHTSNVNGLLYRLNAITKQGSHYILQATCIHAEWEKGHCLQQDHGLDSLPFDFCLTKSFHHVNYGSKVLHTPCSFRKLWGSLHWARFTHEFAWISINGIIRRWRGRICFPSFSPIKIQLARSFCQFLSCCTFACQKTPSVATIPQFVRMYCYHKPI